jgi:hypothetical protein
MCLVTYERQCINLGYIHSELNNALLGVENLAKYQGLGRTRVMGHKPIALKNGP